MRIGIIGSGRIAGRFVNECRVADCIEISAVYNPHIGSARRFVDELWCNKEDNSDTYDILEKQHNVTAIPIATNERDELWDAVDAIYIASPHETHYSYIIQALEHDKHVLCEKPMVLKAGEAQEAFLIAKNHGLVLMEAIKTAYCPGYRKLLEVATGGVIGDIKYIEGCFTKLENPKGRELTDASYGGSFTELGSYVSLPIIDLFGSGYNDIRFSKINNEKGIDIFTRAELTYPDRFATAICGLGVKAEGSLMISGTKGYIKVDAPWWKTRHFKVHFEDASKVISYDEEFEGDGLRYEIEEFIGRIAGSGSDDKDRDYCEMRSVCMADLMEKFLSNR